MSRGLVRQTYHGKGWSTHAMTCHQEWYDLRHAPWSS